jgi:hypothetical protein
LRRKDSEVAFFTRCGRNRPQNELRRFGVSLGELVVGDRPDAFNAAAGTQEQRGTGERNERHKERVFNQVLPLLVIQKAQDAVHFFSRSSAILNRHTNRLTIQDNQSDIGNAKLGNSSAVWHFCSGEAAARRWPTRANAVHPPQEATDIE